MQYSKISKTSKGLKLITIVILLSFLASIISCLPIVASWRLAAGSLMPGTIRSSVYLDFGQTGWAAKDLVYNFFQIAPADDSDKKRNIYGLLSVAILVIIGLLFVYHSRIFCILYYYWHLTRYLNIRFWDFIYSAISQGIIHPKILGSV